MIRKWICTTTIVSAVVLLSGCGLFGPESTSGPKPVDPPQMSQKQPKGPSEEVMKDVKNITLDKNGKQQTEKKPVAGETATIAAPVYLMDPDGYVVPVTVNVPKVEGTAKQVIQYMVDGGPIEAVKPEGFTALLPAGTKVLGMTVKDGVATVDFSPEFKKYDAKNEKKIVDAITYALTSFNNIKEVKIWINGYPQEVMPVKGTPITSLSRANGINLELADNVEIGNTTPVTLYFQAQTADNKDYFVPVTRLIPHTDDLAQATVDQLIKGPKTGTDLFSSILPTTKLLGVKTQNGVEVVNFDDKILSYNDGKANPLAMQSVILSLNETTGAGQVQFMVNGKPTLKAGDKDYSHPVSKPDQINPAKM